MDLEAECGEEDIGNGHPLSYKAIATLLHSVIFIGGCSGNIVLIIVARRTKSLQSPTYRYLVSLAYADLTVLISAIPEALIFHHIGRNWALGQAACSLMVFGNFLGINAGSVSIFVFTVERYVAVMRPLLAQKICTMEHANKLVLAVWIFSVLYCVPWLGLTEVKEYETEDNVTVKICDFRLSKDSYSYFFATDLLLFYVIPLLTSAVIYVKIALRLRKRIQLQREHAFLTAERCSERLHYEITDIPPRGVSPTVNSIVRINSKKPVHRTISGNGASTRADSSVLPMLMLVVLLFAVCWLPFRGLLLYNTFAETPWLDIWYLLFAKTLVYFNSAMNPFLYNIMSVRFREAVYDLFNRGSVGGGSIRSSTRSTKI